VSRDPWYDRGRGRIVAYEVIVVSTQTQVEIGSDFLDYRIEALLGRGGMGVVYRAYDQRLKRAVALKLVTPELALDERFRERFARETELATALEHPNVVPIYDAGEDDGRLYLAMRLVDGTDLGALLREEGPLEPARALAICGQAANALDAAHHKGLVHRDVKPSNVLLDASEHVYLADFGLTRRLEDATAPREDGSSVGTPAYLAPEQIGGTAVDGRADVYSLGCVLFECLTGSLPYGRGSRLATLWAHLEEEPPKPSAERPGLPSALDAVIARALAKDPEERYESCRELVQATLAVTFDEASRRLVEVASRAVVGRSDLDEVEAELKGKVIDVQLVHEQARALARPATPIRADVCPFKGLAGFEPLDAEYFFGRERLVAELVARLVGARLLGIVGPSGSGKSSLLRAGLLPALAGGVLPGSGGWRRLLLRPGEHPLDELRRVLLSGANDPLTEALDALPAEGRLLLAVDQLEEVFTACSSEAERAAFAEMLARAAADPERRAVVVVALRADFYGRFAAYPGLADSLGANQVLVGPLRASELRRVIELPASRVGLQVEPELTDALVEDVEGEPGALPLLSTALLELWQKRDNDRLTLAAYRESGGVHGAVARLAESTYARVPDERKPLVRAVVLRLVGGGEGDAVTRRRAPLAELDLERNEDTAGVLAMLTDSRLVTVDDGFVEVAHEALLREWPRLREWIDEDAEGRRLRRHITQAASEWDATGRDQGELYRGARLAAALDWSTDHIFELNELEREFVSESREASESQTKHVHRTNRRLRALLAGVAVLLAVAVAGGIFAVVQRGQARDAETAQLAQRLGAQALVEDDLDRSLLLARQAVAIDETPQTRGYLLAALRRAPGAIGIMHGDAAQDLRRIAVSPDGKTLAVAGQGGAGIRFLDPETYEQIAPPVDVPTGPYGLKDVIGLAFSPDGETLAYFTSYDVPAPGDLRVIDVRTGEVLAQAAASALDVAFTRDGSQLVLVGHHGYGDLWVDFLDAATLTTVADPIELGAADTERAAFAGLNTPSRFLALTSDGASVVTASPDGELAWWDVRTHKKTRAIEVADGYHAFALSPDGLTAAVGIGGGLQLVDARSGEVRTASRALAEEPQWLLFSPDSETVVSTGFDGAVTVWDVASATPRETLRGHSAPVGQPVFSPDGATLYTASDDGTVIAWDLDGSRRLGRPFSFTHDRAPDPLFDRHPGSFSPDGRLIAVGLARRGIQLWSTTDLAGAGAPLLQTGGEVKALAFGQGGRALAAVTRNGTASVWDVKARSLRIGPFRVDASQALGVSFSRDGTMLATAGSKGVTLWDAVTGAARGRLGEASAADDVAFSPTAPIVAFVRDAWLAGDNPGGIGTGEAVAEIWDVGRRTRIATLHINAGAPDRDEGLGYTLAFSPDGRLLVTAGDDPFVRIWEVTTGRLVRELGQNVGGVLRLEFSPDGRTLAISGKPDASLWDGATGTQVGRLSGGSRRAMLDLTGDGRHLLITSADGRGAVWDIDADSWKRRACALANRTLTREEWTEFLPGRSYEPACQD
jgi:WD40 repeat protein